MASHSTSLWYDFVEKPSEDYYCPVTFEILKDPQQTNSCCGKHISRAAADLLKREGKPCPMCKKAPLQTANDLFFKRQVLTLKIRCSNKALGCEWVGELGQLEQHLKAGFMEGECQDVFVACPNDCGVQVQRRLLYEHKTGRCIKRPFNCQYCDKKATYDNITNEHWSQCQKCPVQCPKECGEAVMERRFLQRHLDQHCPLQEVECQFSYAGCGVRTQRSKMQEHMDQSKDQHLELLAENVRDIRIQFQALSQAVSELMPRPKFIAPPEIVFYNFEQRKNNEIDFYSQSFYSHIGGYKMCLQILPNGWDDGEGTHVAVAVYMMRGEFDDSLQWPFRGEVKVQLINQRDGGKHLESKVLEENDYVTTNLTKYFSRVLEGDRAKSGWGCDQFISHSYLYRPEQGIEYLKNDSLKFKVPHIAVLEK